MGVNLKFHVSNTFLCLHAFGNMGGDGGALILCARSRVCQWLYVLLASYAHVQATVGVGTVLIWYFGVAYTRGGGVHTSQQPAHGTYVHTIVEHPNQEGDTITVQEPLD